MSLFSLRPLWIWPCIALCFLAIAMYFDYQSTTPSTSGASELWLEGLEAKLDTLDQVSVRHLQHTWTAQLKDNQWVLAEEPTYPASRPTLYNIINHSVGFERIEPKTSEADFFEGLGVARAAENNFLATEIELSAHGQPLAAYIMGRERSVPERSVYVREIDKPQSWLVRGGYNIRTDAHPFIDPSFARMPRESIKHVRFSFKTRDKDYSILRDDSSHMHYRLDGYEAKQPETLTYVASLLSDISFTAVQKAEHVLFSDRKNIHVRFTAFDGKVVNMDAMHMNDGLWVRFDSAKDWAYKVDDHIANKIKRKLPDFL